MGHETILDNESFDLPAAFFHRLIGDIPVTTWVRAVRSNPTLREHLLEGFSARPHKLPGFIRQRHFTVRLQRLLQSDSSLLQSILELWGQEQLTIVAFLEMMDQAFLMEYWAGLKNFLGPERFFAGLYLLGSLGEPDVRKQLTDDFWERRVYPEVLEPLLPTLELWNNFAAQYPESRQWFEAATQALSSPDRKESPAEANPERNEPHRKEEERRRKLEQKLEKAREEQSHLQEQVDRYRTENEALRRKLTERENSFQVRLDEAVEHYRRERYQRYQTLEERPLADAQKRIDSLLKRADRAFELQRQADEEYGLVSTVRQKLLQVELYLMEIERIHSDSLFIHSEVTRVKEAFSQEKQRLMQLPGIERILSQRAPAIAPDDLSRKIRLMEATPENLPRITQAERLISKLDSLGFMDNGEALKKDTHQKKRQILEALYACFPVPTEQQSPDRAVRSLEDFVLSGKSKTYDIYVDAYNILLKVCGGKKMTSPSTLSAFREDFIDAVIAKSRCFRKIYLVFDGVESFTDRRGNVEIVYTDKGRGDTADSMIIQTLRKQKGESALLVTADREIIEATKNRVYATINPLHFYAFVFETSPPSLQ